MNVQPIHGRRLNFSRGLLAEKLLTWLRARRGTRPPAIVLGGSVNGLSFARSLGRRQISVLVLESERYAATYTRYATVLLLPPLQSREDLWKELLEFVGTRLDTRGVLFPTSDASCLFVARHGDSLARYFKFIVPAPVTLERILDKRLQYETAQAAGVPVPRVYFPESISDLSAFGNSLVYPCLLKPRQSHMARQILSGKVVVVHSAAELIATYARFSNRLSLMVQEIVPGEDDLLFGYLAFWDAAQREVAWVTKQKLRQFPPQFGDGSLQRTVQAPEVLALSRHLLAAFGYQGFVGVEFKFDARDGR